MIERLKNRLNRAQRPAAPRLTTAPMSHAGQSGVAIFEDGRIAAWGASETAAWSNYQVSRAA